MHRRNIMYCWHSTKADAAMVCCTRQAGSKPAVSSSAGNQGSEGSAAAPSISVTCGAQEIFEQGEFCIGEISERAVPLDMQLARTQARNNAEIMMRSLLPNLPDHSRAVLHEVIRKRLQKRLAELVAHARRSAQGRLSSPQQTARSFLSAPTFGFSPLWGAPAGRSTQRGSG